MTLGVMSELAADVDHDGLITEEDATLILQHVVGKTTINQEYDITGSVSDLCYFEIAVAF